MAVIKTHPNVAAFLDTLAFSEGTATHPLTKNNGYDVIVTGIDGKPEVLPTIAITRLPVGARRRSSIVAGKIHGIRALPAALPVLAALQKQLALPDFSPASQDRLAIQLIRERGALEDLQQGRIERAISRCRNIWASLPGPGTASASTASTNWSQCGARPEVYLHENSHYSAGAGLCGSAVDATR